MKRVDLNVDIGEGFPFDAELLLFATSANICCGVHAGDWDLTKETIGLALDAGARIGMHPGYPDRSSMGRAPLRFELAEEYEASLEAQCKRFFDFVPAAYFKPHGAFYNDSADHGHPSWPMLQRLVREYRIPAMGLPGTAHEGLRPAFYAEGFADRAYTADGRLVSRSQPGAVLDSPAEVRAQAVRLARSVDTICIHGDTPDCLAFAEQVFAALVDAGYEVGS